MKRGERTRPITRSGRFFATHYYETHAIGRRYAAAGRDARRCGRHRGLRSRCRTRRAHTASATGDPRSPSRQDALSGRARGAARAVRSRALEKAIPKIRLPSSGGRVRAASRSTFLDTRLLPSSADLAP